MSKIVRFGVSLEKDLLCGFDNFLKKGNYANRSEGIRDLIREVLVGNEWTEGKEVSGAITLVYDHHKRELLNQLMHIQHDYHRIILSAQHIHLDHENCLEIVVFKGKPGESQELFAKLKAQKGVKHAGFSMSTTGKDVI